jgi:hypothetical protein
MVKLSEDGRYVGQVLLPWKMIVKVEVCERRGCDGEKEAEYRR